MGYFSPGESARLFFEVIFLFAIGNARKSSLYNYRKSAGHPRTDLIRTQRRIYSISENNIIFFSFLFFSMISKLARIFGSKTKAQEILLLVAGLKPVVRQGFYEYELPQVEQFCKENEIYLVKSGFKVHLADGSNYSNKGIRLPVTDLRPGMFFVYLSLDQYKAWQASHFEAAGKDKELGLLLGYPGCCVDFFCKRFSEQNPNLQLKPTNMFTNLTKRAADQVLLSHFPCNSDCVGSIALGKKYLGLIRKWDRERAEELEKELLLLRIA